MGGCSVLGCKSRSEKANHDITFHSFPKDDYIKKVWINATGRKNWQPNRSSKICSIHFDDDEICLANKFRRIKPEAIPVKYVHTPVISIKQPQTIRAKASISSVTSACTSECPTTPSRKRKHTIISLNNTHKSFRMTPARLEKWKKSLGIELKATDYICHLHFKNEHIKMHDNLNVNGERKLFPTGRNILKYEASPTIKHQFIEPLESNSYRHTSESKHQLRVQHKNIKQHTFVDQEGNKILDEQPEQNLEVPPLARKKKLNYTMERQGNEASPHSVENFRNNIKQYPILPPFWLYVEKPDRFEFIRMDPITKQIKNHICLNEDLSITVILPNNEEMTLNEKLNSFTNTYDYLKSVEKWPLCAGTQFDYNKFALTCKGVIFGDDTFKGNQQSPICKCCRKLQKHLQRQNLTKQTSEKKCASKRSPTNLVKQCKPLKRLKRMPPTEKSKQPPPAPQTENPLFLENEPMDAINQDSDDTVSIKSESDKEDEKGSEYENSEDVQQKDDEEAGHDDEVDDDDADTSGADDDDYNDDDDATDITDSLSCSSDYELYEETPIPIPTTTSPVTVNDLKTRAVSANMASSVNMSALTAMLGSTKMGNTRTAPIVPTTVTLSHKQYQTLLRQKHRVEIQNRKIKILQNQLRRKHNRLEHFKTQMRTVKEYTKCSEIQNILRGNYRKLCTVINRNGVPVNYSDDVIKFAISLNYYSPKAYEFIRKYMSLPTARMLEKYAETSTYILHVDD